MLKERNRYIVLIAIIISLCIIVFPKGSCISAVSKKDKPKNIIFIIGDGMGQNHILATSVWYNKKLEMLKTKTIYISTQAANNPITDSAAAGTALATGFKTNTGMIGMTPDGKSKESLAELAKRKGEKIGIITTTEITDATPASFASHTNSRKNRNAIVKQQLRLKPNVLFGGYAAEITKAMIKKSNMKVLYNRKQLKKRNHSNYTLGQFSVENLTRCSTKKNTPTLLEMSKKSISLLKNKKKGFFLMIEAGNIDVFSHKHAPNDNRLFDRDIFMMMKSVKQLNSVVKYMKNYVNKHPDTLLIVTADHETGGLTLPPNLLRSNELSSQEKKNLITNNLFTVDGHTSTRVPLYTYGKGRKYFQKNMDNTEVNHLIERFIK